MNPIHVLLLCGGGSAEHEVSLVSANFVEQNLQSIDGIRYTRIEMKPEGWFDQNHQRWQLNLDRSIQSDSGEKVPVDYVIPCVHGYPGETGDLQSLLELVGLPYFGCGPQASTNCFNKITSKLWFDALGIPNTPYVFLSELTEESLKSASDALERWGSVFVKAACQGSSVGCYRATDEASLREAIQNAFTFSDQVLVEKTIRPRELEVAAYQYGDELIITKPGEVSCPDGQFYTYEEKYSADSHSTTVVEATNISEAQVELIRAYARKAFVHLKLKDLSRIDFFLSEDNEILLNEINTFPGMTPISMFPQMLAHHGHQFSDYLEKAIKKGILESVL
ncbi:D-alanine--D-alanine ligase [Photobacterium galatheae]|uniref:D-alanine--D-alanine ligase n=1 Tax=Photobacterium galatheae TaxID=1654360 RepID=A0A066RQE2_9GAMM|nr:D-alanine--D-alanine ligase [Photobacterium galatheae]KDM89907.1 D-alanine--D-alanine ligase [Photobacterium galatheae]MCM0149743.1 D-alanine--D-alanine ligase [Photobacterium galatheae]